MAQPATLVFDVVPLVLEEERCAGKRSDAICSKNTTCTRSTTTLTAEEFTKKSYHFFFGWKYSKNSDNVEDVRKKLHEKDEGIRSHVSFVSLESNTNGMRFGSGLSSSWIENIALRGAELETMSVLYSKSIIGLTASAIHPETFCKNEGRGNARKNYETPKTRNQSETEKKFSKTKEHPINRELGGNKAFPDSASLCPILKECRNEIFSQELLKSVVRPKSVVSPLAKPRRHVLGGKIAADKHIQWRRSAVESSCRNGLESDDSQTNMFGSSSQSIFVQEAPLAPNLFRRSNLSASPTHHFCPSPRCQQQIGSGECPHRASIRLRQVPKIVNSSRTAAHSSADQQFRRTQKYCNKESEDMRPPLSRTSSVPITESDTTGGNHNQEFTDISENESNHSNEQTFHPQSVCQQHFFPSDSSMPTRPARHSILVNEHDDNSNILPHQRHDGYILPNNSNNPSPLYGATLSSADSGHSSIGAFADKLSGMRNQRNQSPPIAKGRNIITTAFKEFNLDRIYSCALHKSELLVGLPNYLMMTNSIDRLLRLSSTLYSLLGSENAIINKEQFKHEFVHKARSICQLIKQSLCIYATPTSYLFYNQDVNSLVSAVNEVEFHLAGDSSGMMAAISNECHGHLHFITILVRKMLEQMMLICIRIVCAYLADCDASEKLLILALEHLIHLLLFGDELGLEAVKNGAVDELTVFCQLQNTPPKTLKLILRTLAVLCGTSKGCLQLLSVGGLDIVLRLLLDAEASTDCSIEAAGVLTQLTSLGHSVVRLTQSLQPVLLRLLFLVDHAKNSESLLLCVASIANLSLQNMPAVAEILYTHNAVLKLVRAVNRPSIKANIFVKEQIIAIFSRMASRGYEQALIAQGAIPLLISMISVQESKHIDYCRRINYKAAVCLGTMAFNGFGLKSIYEHKGYDKLCEVMSRECEEQQSNGSNGNGSPLLLICSSIKQRLESRYTGLILLGTLV